MEYWKNAAEIPPGEYLCNRYGSTIYRKKKKYFLFLVQNDKEIPVYGHFVDQEIDRIGTTTLENRHSPIVCRIGPKTKVGRKMEPEIQIL